MKEFCIDWNKSAYLIASNFTQTDSAIIVETNPVPNGETWYVKAATAAFIFHFTGAEVGTLGGRLSGFFLCPPSTPQVVNDGGNPAVPSNFLSRPISIPLDDDAYVGGAGGTVDAGFTTKVNPFFVIPQEWTLRAVIWQGGAGLDRTIFAWLIAQYVIDRKPFG